MFPNWLGRKCRNHNPLSELKLSRSARLNTPNLYHNEEALPDQVMLVESEDRNQIVYHNGMHAFMITVEPITLDQAATLNLVKVKS